LGETTRDDDPETRTRERAFERDGKDAENLSAREPARRFVRAEHRGYYERLRRPVDVMRFLRRF